MEVLINKPTILTNKYWVNCLEKGNSRDSGYVHKRFQRKLLKTAMEKEKAFAETGEIPKYWMNKLKKPISISVPLNPTSANLANRIRSFLLEKII